MTKLSVSSKWELFGALYKYGSNIEQVKKALGDDWNEDIIEKAINGYKLRVGRKLKAKITKKDVIEEPIDAWYDFIKDLHKIEAANIEDANIEDANIEETSLNESSDKSSSNPNYSNLLKKSFMYAACFEEHYQGSSSEEPNYNEIYRYFAQLLAGEEPTQLRPGNAKKIKEMMIKFKELLESKDSTQRYQNYIMNNHTASFLQPGVDVWNIVKEKKDKPLEISKKDVAHLFSEDGTDELSLSTLSEKDTQYFVKKEKILLKLSLKQRALAALVNNIPGMNPYEIILPSLVKPNSSIQVAPPKPKRRKLERR